MRVDALRKKLCEQLFLHSDSPQLDADLILMHVLKKSRAQLLISLNDSIDENSLKNIDDLISRRCHGEPIAYLLGHQPFWTLDLIVTTDTLIPRPETECLIEWALENFSGKNNLDVADLGTGTGAIAIALATEKPNWIIDATDFSSHALMIAKENAKKYAVKNISFYEGDWFDALPHKKYDLIFSNPPYIAENDSHLAKLQFEPQSALVSGINGLDAILKIVNQATCFLKSGGTLIIEHGFDQADAVKLIFENAGFKAIKNHRDLAGNNRFTTGKVST